MGRFAALLKLHACPCNRLAACEATGGQHAGGLFATHLSAAVRTLSMRPSFHSRPFFFTLVSETFLSRLLLGIAAGFLQTSLPAENLANDAGTTKTKPMSLCATLKRCLQNVQ